MFHGATLTKFGRVHRVEHPAVELLHFHTPGAPLREVEHAIPIPVLDQEDLDKQGIDTSKLVPGAPRVTALGSCTANGGTASLTERLATAGKPLPAGLDAGSAKACEEWAIEFYAACTHQTNDTAAEWPPTDCGSTGAAVCAEMETQQHTTGHTIPVGVLGTLSALQAGSVIQGTPWFYEWMHPDSSALVDGDGSPDAVRAAIASGVAGGHETCIRGISQLAVVRGHVDLQHTILKVRNSWSTAFADAGDFYLHASTLDMLAQYVDFKQFTV
jgi:hypothetical protein